MKAELRLILSFDDGASVYSEDTLDFELLASVSNKGEFLAAFARPHLEAMLLEARERYGDQVPDPLS